MLGPKYFDKPLRWKTIEALMKKHNVSRRGAEMMLYNGRNPLEPFSGKYK